jgi:hypothetical protein
MPLVTIVLGGSLPIKSTGHSSFQPEKRKKEAEVFHSHIQKHRVYGTFSFANSGNDLGFNSRTNPIALLQDIEEIYFNVSVLILNVSLWIK